MNQMRDDGVAHGIVDLACAAPCRAIRRHLRVEVYHPGRVRRPVQVEVGDEASVGLHISSSDERLSTTSYTGRITADRSLTPFLLV